MSIHFNAMAAAAHRYYTQNLNAMARSMERLSSGYRINRAADDAAGLCISEKMRAQIRGLNMAARNSQDAISMVQTAEGALGEVNSILQRMNELAVQAATGTNQGFDRLQAAKEFEQLKQEINDISTQTTFNDMKLLDGSLSYVGEIRSAQTAGVNMSTAQDGSSTLTFDFAKLREGDVISFEVNSKPVTVTRGGQSETRSQFFDKVAAAVAATGVSGVRAKGEAVLADKDTTISDVRLADWVERDTNACRIQVGALEGQQLSIPIDCINTASLGLDGMNLFDQNSAGQAITACRDALAKVTDQRATLGAMHNRLDYKISNLKNQSLNLSAAESRIRDVDIAEEMTNFLRHSILVQVGMAMMAQANALAQNVLSLLR